MSTVKSFFDYAVTEGYIEFNPARIKKRKNRATRQLDARHEQEEPFSDAEIERLYGACRTECGQGSRVVEFKSTLGKPVSYVLDIGAINRTWTGQGLEGFIAVSVWTGLCISDVATFQMDRVNKEGGILVRTTNGRQAGLHGGAGLVAVPHPGSGGQAWLLDLRQTQHHQNRRHQGELAALAQ